MRIRKLAMSESAEKTEKMKGRDGGWRGMDEKARSLMWRVRTGRKCSEQYEGTWRPSKRKVYIHKLLRKYPKERRHSFVTE
jgi:hypothetical protein